MLVRRGLDPDGRRLPLRILATESDTVKSFIALTMVSADGDNPPKENEKGELAEVPASEVLSCLFASPSYPLSTLMFDEAATWGGGVTFVRRLRASLLALSRLSRLARFIFRFI